MGIGLVIVGLLVLLWLAGFWFAGNFAWPFVLAAIGFAVLWARGDGRWNLASLGTPLSLTRFAIGALLILGGMAAFLAASTSVDGLGSVLLAMIVALGGAALLAGPWIWGMGRQLVDERSSRVRSEERAEMAAHLHDSVLQTLALIQRSKAEREMVSLARTQERELRAWLYGRAPELAGVRLRDAIDSMAGRIERQHQVSVEAVVVGDAEMDERLRGLVNACAEAVANAAVHSGSTAISVYVEVEKDLVTAFVRDQGSGFDPAVVPADRRGIADSIVGRMERHGGTATVHSEPGCRHGGRPQASAEGVVTIRVFVVDDHELFRSGVRSELGRDVEIVGDAGTVDEAVPAIVELRPDVVLLDVHMAGGGGRAVIEAVRPERPDVKFLALSVSDAAEDVIGIIRAGARGYVTKSISAEELSSAVQRIHDGDAVFSPRLAGFVLDAFGGDAPQPLDPELDLLSRREREVLRYIARGYTYKEVAHELHISVKTVETHVSAVLRKLQLSSRYELTRWAADRRLV